jgi:hypothetical protein
MHTHIVAFLDLLGFSNYTKEDIVGTGRLLADQQEILGQRLSEAQNPNLIGQIPEWMQVDGFHHFLPFSDSTLIIGNDPNKFLRQLADFLRACFLINSHAYFLPDDPEHPEKVRVLDASLSAIKTAQEMWYPAQWRGALAIGEVHVFEVLGIARGKSLKVPNAIGPAIVEAVKLEKSGKGPRLFCPTRLPEHLTPDLREYFQPVHGLNGVSEFLWPAVNFNRTTFDPQMNDFYELWSPAVNLWKSKTKPHVAFEHYDQFLRLLIRSAVCSAKLVDATPTARDYIRNRIRQDLSDEFVDDYLS